MNYYDYETAFSAARLSRYLTACNGNQIKALSLYRLNIRLCQKFYGILNIFEVVLRNAIDKHYKTALGDSDWINNQLQQGGMLEHTPKKQKIFDLITELAAKGTYSNDKVVSSVSFGFWTYLFTKIPYRLGGSGLLRIFPNRTHGLGQRIIYNELKRIQSFRNRIAHHEAICFNAQGMIDMTSTKAMYVLILKYIAFLGYNSNQLLFGIDILPDNIIDKIIHL